MVTNRRNIAYLWALFPTVLVVTGNFTGDWWTLLNTFFTLVVLGILEIVLPDNTKNSANKSAVLPDTILKLALVFQILSVLSLFVAIYTEKLIGGWVIAGAISTGINTGTLAIVTAHEMIHRKGSFWQRVGKFQLFTAGNIYFYNEHLFIHHKLVGTDKDPVSAKRGENYYTFVIRSITGQLKGAWRIEKEKLIRKNKPLISSANYMGLYGLLLLLLVIVLALVQWQIALAFIIQGITANFLLEYTNYVEHYGL